MSLLHFFSRTLTYRHNFHNIHTLLCTVIITNTFKNPSLLTLVHEIGIIHFSQFVIMVLFHFQGRTVEDSDESCYDIKSWFSKYSHLIIGVVLKIHHSRCSIQCISSRYLMSWGTIFCLKC